MTAALALAAALGIPPRAVAEWLPDIEIAMVRGFNGMGEHDGDETGPGSP